MGKEKPFIDVPCRVCLLSTSFDRVHDEGRIEWTLNPKYDNAAKATFGDTRQDVINEDFDGEYKTTVLMTNADQLLLFLALVGPPCVISILSGVLQVEVYDGYRE